MKFPTFQVTLTHPGDEPDEKYEVYLDLMLDEADALLKWTGLTWQSWLAAVDSNEPDALRFLYWLARKRAGNPVTEKFSDITFWLHSLTREIVDEGDFGPVEAESLELTGPDPTQDAATE
jgi:hypothetical protein